MGPSLPRKRVFSSAISSTLHHGDGELDRVRCVFALEDERRQLDERLEGERFGFAVTDNADLHRHLLAGRYSGAG